MSRYLQFSNVGRSKFSGRKLLHPEIVSPDHIANVAVGEAAMHLMSRCIDGVYDPEKNEGIIYAGFGKVGEFSITEE